MSTGWDSLEDPGASDGERKGAGHTDPVSDFSHSSAGAVDTPYVEQDTESDHSAGDEFAGEGGVDHDGAEESAPAKRKKPIGMLIGMAAFGGIALGGAYLVLAPFISILTGGPGNAAAAPPSGSANPLAMQALKADAEPTSAAGQAPASAPVAAPATPASAAEGVANPASGVTTPVVMASAPLSEAGVAQVPKAADIDTAKQVEAVLSNPGAAAPDQAKNTPARASAAVSPAPEMVIKAPAPVARRAQEQPSGNGPTNERTTAQETATSRRTASASTTPRHRLPHAPARSHSRTTAAPAPDRSSERVEQLMGYTLLAINPRTGDFQQAWVRDSQGKLQILSKGDRLGSVQVLRIDGEKGEVVTAAGVVR